MSEPSLGYLSKCGVGKESVYGVPVLVTQCAAMISENITDDFTQLPDLTLQGRASGRQPDQGMQPIKGDLVLAWRYVPQDLILEQWFGSLASGIYTPLLSVQGKGLTIAFWKRQSVWELSGCKISKLVFAGTTTGVKLTASLMATGITRSSVLNTAAVLDALPLNTADTVLFTDLRLRHGERSGPLGSEDEYGVSDFTLTLDRPMDEQFTNQGRQAIEMLENNVRTTTLAFKVPRYDSDQFYTWRDAQARLQTEFYFSGGSHSKKILLPQVTMATVKSAIAGPAPLPVDVTTQIKEAEDALVSTAIAATASGNSLTIDSSSAVAASGTLTLTGSVSDGETVTIGSDVYEVDTNPNGPTVASGRIAVGLSGGSTRQAKGTLTLGAQPTAGDTLTIGSKTYLFQANGSLTNVDGHIEIGSSLPSTQTNVRNAINRTGTPGTGYAAAMTKHPSVTLGAFSANAAVVTANEGGTAGNSLASTSTFTSGANHFDAATLGTTQAGVNPTAAEFVAAFVASVIAAGTEPVVAAPGAGTTVVLTAEEAGSQGNSIATTETLANGSFGAAHLTGGSGTLDTFPYCLAGSTAYLSGFATAGNNGQAPIVSWDAHTLVLASAANGGLDLTDEVAGASVTLVVRSFDVQLVEV
jgi:hypothetical protein